MNFINTEHEDRFRELILRAKVVPGDTERVSMFYIFAYNDNTYRNIKDLYDFEDDVILFDGLNEGWQTGTSRKLTKLGFNLYNGFNDEENRCDVLNVTCGLDMEHITMIFRAVAIRNNLVDIFQTK